MGTSKKPSGASKIAKPIPGKRPKTPHDGSVYQAGGAIPGSKTIPGMTKAKNNVKTGRGRRL